MEIIIEFLTFQLTTENECTNDSAVYSGFFILQGENIENYKIFYKHTYRECSGIMEHHLPFYL